MTTFVLVHGAWGGAHTWRNVRPLLTIGGHQVFTPALTGIGERAHLASPQVGLTTHVEDVTRQIVYEDLTEIVLLGFSYGGMVVTGALEHVSERVSELVYLDAFVPGDRQAVVDITGFAVERGLGLGSDWSIPPIERTFEDPGETEFAAPRRTPQPARTFTEPVRLIRPLESFGFGLTYVKATPRRPVAERARRILGCRRPLSPPCRLEIRGDRQQPHGSPEPPRRTRRDPALVGLNRHGPTQPPPPTRRMIVPRRDPDRVRTSRRGRTQRSARCSRRVRHGCPGRSAHRRRTCRRTIRFRACRTTGQGGVRGSR